MRGSRLGRDDGDAAEHKRAREIDRPRFNLLGNRTLLDIAEAKPRTQAALAELEGVSELIVCRISSDLVDAKLEGNGRRRMDRRAERRLATLKKWRSERATELGLDPGVLCPNSALESMSIDPPADADELARRKEIKSWFAREFGAEVAGVLAAREGEAEGEGAAD